MYVTKDCKKSADDVCGMNVLQNADKISLHTLSCRILSKLSEDLETVNGFLILFTELVGAEKTLVFT
jgi:hypothetical protein